ncbi:hypothetical protein [Microcystis aeruginosa]|nr:hypothetical protein [Microcystis aeruginosa]
MTSISHFSSKQEVKELIPLTDRSLFWAKSLGKNQLVTKEKFE